MQKLGALAQDVPEDLNVAFVGLVAGSPIREVSPFTAEDENI